jgi:hypothetical protein
MTTIKLLSKIVDEKVTDDWDECKKGLYCALLDSSLVLWYVLILFISASGLQFEFFL